MTTYARPDGIPWTFPGVVDVTFALYDSRTEAAVALIGGTYTLAKEDGTELLTAESMSVSGGELTFTDNSVAGLVAGEVYRETIVYSTADKVSVSYSRDLYVHATAFAPQVKTQDLLDALPVLANYPSGETSWGKAITSVHDRLLASLLVSSATRRHALWTPGLWRNYELYASIAMALRQMGTLTGGVVLEQADAWDARAAREYERVLNASEWDIDNDGAKDADKLPVGASASGPDGGRAR